VVQGVSDISADGWVTQTGATATYTEISEPVPDDSTYIRSPSVVSGTSGEFVMRLGVMTDPGTAPFGLSLRLRNQTGAAKLRVTLLDAGSTPVANRLIDATATFAPVSFEFTTLEKNAYRSGGGFDLGGEIKLVAEV